MPDDGPIKFVKPENPPDLSSLVRPGVGIVFSGCPRETQIVFQDLPVASSSSDATGRILSLLSSTFAKLSVLVRSCIGNAREMQDRFREKNKIPKSAKIQYQPAPVSDVVQAIMLQCVATIGALFGNAPSSYALEKFAQATSTGDMRAFKIRLLFLKVRDSLKGSPMYKDFVERLEDAISESESMAGCKPDNSPRRLSKAEQERKRRIQERLDAKRKAQLELPLVWPDETDGKESYQQVINKLSTPEDNSGSASEGEPPKSHFFNILKKHHFCEIDNSNSNEEKSTEKSTEECLSDLTVKREDELLFNSKKNGVGEEAEIVRKKRDYETVDQILSDIELGEITRYESTEEIKADLKSGKITPVDALMFTAALERYKEDCCVPEDPDEEEIDACLAEGPECYEEEEGCDEEDEEDEDDEPRQRRRTPRSSFSYNPRGFCGIGGGYSASGEWDRDDAW